MNQPDPNAASGSKSATEWTEHEHTAASVDIEAQKVAAGDASRQRPLVEQAGSKQIADKALEAVERRSQSTPAQPSEPDQSPPADQSSKDRLADRLGYESFLAMYEASKKIDSGDLESPWYATPDRHGRWFIWSDAELDALQGFGTFGEAAESIRRRSPK